MLSEKLLKLKKKILNEVAENFSRVEEISERNTLKVSDAHFSVREKLVEIFKSEAAPVK